MKVRCIKYTLSRVNRFKSCWWNGNLIKTHNKKSAECKYCNKQFSRHDNMKRHLLTCEEKEKDDTVKESMTELARLLNEKDIIFYFLAPKDMD